MNREREKEINKYRDDVCSGGGGKKLTAVN